MKLILSVLLIFIISVVSVSAVPSSDELFDCIQFGDGTAGGGFINSSLGNLTGGLLQGDVGIIDAHVGEGLSCQVSGGRAVFDSSTKLTTFWNGDEYTYSFIVNTSDVSSRTITRSDTITGGIHGMFLNEPMAGRLSVFEGTDLSAGYLESTITSINDGTPYMVTVRKNATKLYLFINGTLDSERFIVNGTRPGDTKIGICHAFDAGIGGAMKGTIDEWSFYGRALTEAEILDLYNGGSYQTCNNLAGILPDTDAPVVTFINPTPSNDSEINFLPVPINITITDASSIDTATLEWNITPLFSFGGVNGTDTFTNQNGHFSALIDPMGTGNISYTIFVNDSEGNFFQSQTMMFLVDNVNPLVTFGVPSSSNTSSVDNDDTFVITGANILLVSQNITIFNTSLDVQFQEVINVSTSSSSFIQPVSTVMSGLLFQDYIMRATYIDSVNLSTSVDVFFTYAAVGTAGQEQLPLENLANIGGMVALFLILAAIILTPAAIRRRGGR